MKERARVDRESDVGATAQIRAVARPGAGEGGAVVKKRYRWAWDMDLEIEPAGFAS